MEKDVTENYQTIEEWIETDGKGIMEGISNTIECVSTKESQIRMIAIFLRDHLHTNKDKTGLVLSEKDNGLKLYVWDYAYERDNACACAHDSGEARQLLIKKYGYSHDGIGHIPRIIDKPEAF